MSASASTAAATFVLLLFLFTHQAIADEAAAHAPEAGGKAVGGRTEIKDAGSDREVQSLGRFAVREHNRRLRHGGVAGDRVKVQLAFARVAAAQKQVVSGVAYYLKVIARDRAAGAGGERPFDAVVVVKAWAKSKELVSFAPSPK